MNKKRPGDGQVPAAEACKAFSHNPEDWRRRFDKQALAKYGCLVRFKKRFLENFVSWLQQNLIGAAPYQKDFQEREAVSSTKRMISLFGYEACHRLRSKTPCKKSVHKDEARGRVALKMVYIWRGEIYEEANVKLGRVFAFLKWMLLRIQLAQQCGSIIKAYRIHSALRP